MKIAFLTVLLLAPGALSQSAATPAPAPTAKPGKQYVLVQVDGSDPDVRAFVPHFLSEAADRVPIADGSLSGVRLSDLKGDPSGARSTAFREQWPADVWVSVMLSECGRRVRQRSEAGFPDPMTGARTTRIVTTIETTCPAGVTLVDAASGRDLSTTNVVGTSTTDPEAGSSGADPAEAAAHDAAERAAKKALPKKR